MRQGLGAGCMTGAVWMSWRMSWRGPYELDWDISSLSLLYLKYLGPNTAEGLGRMGQQFMSSPRLCEKNHEMWDEGF